MADPTRDSDPRKPDRPDSPASAADQETPISDDFAQRETPDDDDIVKALAAAARVDDELNAETEPLFDDDADEPVGPDTGPAQAAASVAPVDEPAPPAPPAPAASPAEADDVLALEAQADAEAGRVDEAEPAEPVPPVEAAAAEAMDQPAVVEKHAQMDGELEPGGMAEPAALEDLQAGAPLPYEPPTHPSRRSLAKSAAVLIGAVGTLTPLAAGLWAATDPLTRNKAGRDSSGDAGFIPVGSVAAVPPDGTPRKFNVIADKKDAWTIHRNVPIGAVYVRRNEAGDLQAFNAACPHLGCFVNTAPDGSFSCPCHDSEFEADGQIRPITRTGAKTVSLRGLDELDTKLSEDGQTVLVKFENYLAGLAERKRTP